MLKLLRANAEVIATIILVALALVFKPHADDAVGIGIVAVLLIAAFIARDFFRLAFMNRIFDTAAPWLYFTGFKSFPFQSLMKEERRTEDGAKIYIVAPNLALDTRKKEVIEVVKANMLRGIWYVFIARSDAASAEMIEQLKHTHRNPNVISIYAAKSDAIQMITSDNVMIIDHLTGERSGYLQIPEGTGDYWARNVESHATPTEFYTIKTSGQARAAGSVPNQERVGGSSGLEGFGKRGS